MLKYNLINFGYFFFLILKLEENKNCNVRIIIFIEFCNFIEIGNVLQWAFFSCHK